jgi:GTP-binding protein
LQVRDAMQWQPPPALAGKGQGKIYYANQISHSPPTFAFFCNRPALFSDNYKRYLERKLRESLAFEGTPLRFVWRGKRVREIGQENKKGQSSTKAGSSGKTTGTRAK